jgi:hypothetical protein
MCALSPSGPSTFLETAGGNTRLRRGEDLPLARAFLPQRHPFKPRDRLRVSKRQLGTQGLHGFGTWLRTPREIDELGGGPAEQLTSGRERPLALLPALHLTTSRDAHLICRCSNIASSSTVVKVEWDAARGTNGGRQSGQIWHRRFGPGCGGSPNSTASFRTEPLPSRFGVPALPPMNDVRNY